MNQIAINLDLLSYQSKLKRIIVAGKEYIIDPIRKQKIVLQPEEFVRQLFIQYLLSSSQSAATRIAIEKQFIYNGLIRRYDLMIYNKDMQPHTLVECKSAQHTLKQQDLDQLINYNIKLNAQYLILTNGIMTHGWKITNESNSVQSIINLQVDDLFN